MNKIAIIVAGGSGVRMKSSVPKQFMLLGGRPIIYYTVDTFLKAFENLAIILVLPKEYMQNGEEIIKQYFDTKRIIIMEGGPTRFHSVKNGLKFVKEASIVFVHDGVRCFISKELIHRCYEAAMRNGVAIPAITSKDSVRIIDEGATKSIDRKKILLIQTPQTFKSDVLLPAFDTEYKGGFTDEASVVEANQQSVHIVEGEETNIKITTQSDIAFAEWYLNEVKSD